jgi:hypothetical protein
MVGCHDYIILLTESYRPGQLFELGVSIAAAQSLCQDRGQGGQVVLSSLERPPEPANLLAISLLGGVPGCAASGGEGGFSHQMLWRQGLRPPPPQAANLASGGGHPREKCPLTASGARTNFASRRAMRAGFRRSILPAWRSTEPSRFLIGRCLRRLSRFARRFPVEVFL